MLLSSSVVNFLMVSPFFFPGTINIVQLMQMVTKLKP
jgi:hypothetical protein